MKKILMKKIMMKKNKKILIWLLKKFLYIFFVYVKVVNKYKKTKKSFKKK